ncbi:MAG: ribosome-associated translation inhibitor RaiA [Oscillospiraceae bacterium]
MNISITARKTTIKDSFRERVSKKMAKFDRFFDDQANAIVTVTNERDRETVEMTINYNGMIFRAEKTTADRVDSLDAVVDVIFQQIIKNKSKLASRVRATAFDDLDEADFGAETPAYELVKRKKFPVYPMEVEEAILQMNMLGHEFFMFENAHSGEINVVYRRHSGTYGLIEPIR